MTSFKLAFHSKTRRRIVEVWEGPSMIAVIYPDDGSRTIKVISKYVTATKIDERSPPLPDATIVSFSDKEQRS